jgi:ferredoxin
MSDTSGHYSVVIEPKGFRFEAAASGTLLESARLSNVVLPSSCRNGTCRECMCRMISGRVKYRIEWPGLSADEKVEGYILPCVALPESDIVLDVPRAAIAGG